MHVRASDVLNDCRKAQILLEQNLSYNEWKIYWVATIALLRAVGHVLDKVDSKESELLKAIIKHKWDSVNSDHAGNLIFHEFIKIERDSILKDYQWGASFDRLTYGGDVMTYGGDEMTYFSYSAAGAEKSSFKGKSPLELVEEAIAWWECYIECILSELSKRQNT